MSQRTFSKFNVYTIRLIKEIKTISTSNDCKELLNNLIYYLIDKYIKTSIELCYYANKITIDSTALITCTSMWLDEYTELLNYAKGVWEKYDTNTTKNLKKHVRAGLILPPSRIHNYIKVYKYSTQKISETAYIFLTAIIEYLLKKIVTIALQFIINEKVLTSKHIYLALQSKEFCAEAPIFKHIFIAGLSFY